MAKTLDEAGVKRLIQEIKGANKNLNTPIPISTENTTESMAQNVKNIADYVAKAKAAGIANVNGMAVTCLIDYGYSGVGYLYGEDMICGINTYDDLATPYNFVVDYDGLYIDNPFIVKGTTDQVTSDMLVEGARKPIILTPSTTEVDEETYQKLLSDDVDVVFKDATDVFNILYDRVISETTITLTFVSVTCSDTTNASSYVFSRFPIFINKVAPHTLQVSGPAENNLEEILNDSNYLNKSTLIPVLQEIDLSGTDADRKAKLDQFETDWKALTGSAILNGARFVGCTYDYTGVFTYDSLRGSGYFAYADTGESGTGSLQLIQLDASTGSLTITPLFSHLEAITIKSNNTTASKVANVAAIKAYVDNLTALGVDTTKGFLIPINVEGQGSGFISRLRGTDSYMGIMTSYGIPTFGIAISVAGEYYSYRYQTDSDNSLTTESKQIVPAINEINANAVHSDKFVPTLEAITIKTKNSTDDKAANKAAIEAYRDNLTALGVDVTKGYMIPITDGTYQGVLMSLDSYKKRYRGQLYKDDEHYYPLYIEEDGAIHVSDIFISYTSNLSTTSTQIVGAINEVNALAKGYSTIFTPIELTTETAQNKTAIDARVAAFTAQGISLTNGCCIPVTYKGVYAGNISLINGDWYGLLVKNTNNPADNINIKLSADGTITEGNSAQ